jgi:hypothetical protein
LAILILGHGCVLHLHLIQIVKLNKSSMNG